MSLFKKKKKPTEQPSLPELPDLSELPELPNLPELPESGENMQPMTSNLPRPSSAIGSPILPNKPPKSYTNLPFPLKHVPLTKEVSSGKEEVTSDFQTNRIGVAGGGKPRTLEIEEFSQTPIIQEMPEPAQLTPPPIARTRAEPVFVRIDKYQAAVQAFNEIKSQLEEIESYLKEVRNLKQQEESELADWEQEIETIKARLNNIDQGVFGKLG